MPLGKCQVVMAMCSPLLWDQQAGIDSRIYPSQLLGVIFARILKPLLAYLAVNGQIDLDIISPMF